ncbi:MAG: hypothetical protein ACK5NK_16200 [Niabella sp.]
MIKNIFFLLCIVLLLSCKNRQTGEPENNNANRAGQVFTPVQLNQKVIDLENSMAEPILKAEAEIKVRSQNGNMEGVVQSAKAIEDSIQLRIDELNKISPVGVNGADFKLIATRYFEYMKSIYTTYKEIALAKDDAEKSAKAKQMESIIKAQADVVSNLQQAQQKYATENGFVY